MAARFCASLDTPSRQVAAAAPTAKGVSEGIDEAAQEAQALEASRPRVATVHANFEVHPPDYAADTAALHWGIDRVCPCTGALPSANLRGTDGPPRNAAKKRPPDRDSSSEDDDQQKKRTRDRDYSSEDDDQPANESTVRRTSLLHAARPSTTPHADGSVTV
ncbi:hypothetical protein M885DRAFT_535432, partial [Pelagophyceae sp. CCMP2097]